MINTLKLTNNPYTIPGVNIVSTVAYIVGITPEQMKAETRKRCMVLKRQLAMFLLAQHTNMSYTQIGKEFNKDRGTVRHARKTIINLTFGDKQFRQHVANLQSRTPNLKSRHNDY